MTLMLHAANIAEKPLLSQHCLLHAGLSGHGLKRRYSSSPPPAADVGSSSQHEADAHAHAKRLHRANPTHPQHRYTDAQRAAMVCAAAAAMGQLGVQGTTEAVVRRARQLLLDGSIPLADAGPANEWIKSNNCAADIRRFYEEFVAYGTVRAADISVVNHQHAGQNAARVTEAEMDECIQGIIQADAAGLWLHNREVAATHVPAITAVLEKHGITGNHLFRLLQAHNSNLKVLVIAEPRLPLPDDVKAQRLSYANRMLNLTRPVLDRLVGIGQKKIMVRPETTIKSWAIQGHTSKEARITNPLLDDAHKGWALYYYLAVSPVVGPVLIKPMTGCRGTGVQPSGYQVNHMV